MALLSTIPEIHPVGTIMTAINGLCLSEGTAENLRQQLLHILLDPECDVRRVETWQPLYEKISQELAAIPQPVPLWHEVQRDVLLPVAFSTAMKVWTLIFTAIRTEDIKTVFYEGSDIDQTAYFAHKHGKRVMLLSKDDPAYSAIVTTYKDNLKSPEVAELQRKRERRWVDILSNETEASLRESLLIVGAGHFENRFGFIEALKEKGIELKKLADCCIISDRLFYEHKNRMAHLLAGSRTFPDKSVAWDYLEQLIPDRLFLHKL